jgi:hypothetical protein
MKLTHVNRQAFSGVLTRVDEPSTKAPKGARKEAGMKLHRVFLPREVAEVALPTLCGMALNCKAGLKGHDERQPVGIITDAVIVGHELIVRGYIFSRNFPDMAKELAGRDDLGMSYELHNAHIDDMTAAIWRMTRVTFTGAAVLLRAKSAYSRTSFTLHDYSAEAPVHLAGQTDTVIERLDAVVAEVWD